MSIRPSQKQSLKVGDKVEVRSLNEIMTTLDESGCLDGLPFMPEMIKYCGQSSDIYRRVVQFVFDGSEKCRGESPVREFRNNDVYLLNAIRCCGSDHGGCKRGCMIFWKKAWLRTPTAHDAQSGQHELARDLTVELRAMTPLGNYICQSSRLLDATMPISLQKRFGKCVASVRARNCSAATMAHRLFVWFLWRVRRAVLGEQPRGKCRKTPVEKLDLKPGDWVEVKSCDEIVTTLDSAGCNRGLHCTTDMAQYCGRQFQVKDRCEMLIDEGTGRSLGIANTVILEGVCYAGVHYVFGGCPREDQHYWREIWLRRIDHQKRFAN